MTTAHFAADDVFSINYIVDGQAYRAVWDVLPNPYAKGVTRTTCQ